MKKLTNKTHIEGLLYSNDLKAKVTGQNSKNPGTTFIQGNINIATDNAVTNIITVHYSYVAPTFPSGKTNRNYAILEQIMNGTTPCVMVDGPQAAAKIHVNSAIGLNDYFVQRDSNSEPELVSLKRNEGGFITIGGALEESEDKRNTFEADMVITNVRHMDADEERGLPEKDIVKGAIFDYANNLLPVEFAVTLPEGISYFEACNASAQNPFFTCVSGNQISETVTKRTEKANAFGKPIVNETKTSHKEYVIIGASPIPYEWNTPETLTEQELRDAMSNREIHLAEVKQNWLDYQKSQSKTSAPASSSRGAFNF